MFRPASVLLALGVLAAGGPLLAQPGPVSPPANYAAGAVNAGHLQAELVAQTAGVAPGGTAYVAIRQSINKGWHTYWRNPGDAGVAPELRFTLPDGGSVGAVAWPAPQRQPEGPLMTYGYSGEVVLVAPVTGAAHGIRLHASWLVCKDICVPEEGDFRLDLGAGPAVSAEAPLFAAAEAALPRPSPWSAQVAPDGTLTVSGEGISAAAVRDAWFIPAAAGSVNGTAPQPLRVRDEAFKIGRASCRERV